MDIENQRGAEDTPLTRGDVAALVAIGTKIAGHEGRHNFETTCPYCKSAITTDIQSRENEDARTSLNTRYMLVGGFLTLLIVGTFGAMAVSTRTVLMPLLAMAGFLLPVYGAIYCSMWWTEDMFHDVKHSCPRCKEELGVSNGNQAWHDYDSRQARYR